MQISDFTTLADEADYYDPPALLERLTNGISASSRQVVFVVGSALTAPQNPSQIGIPGVDGVIEFIRSEFSDAPRNELDQLLSNSANRYQEAFRFLLGRRGPQAANSVIRRAVASARHAAAPTPSTYELTASTSEDACRGFEADATGWFLPPGVRALGELAVGHPQHFGRTVLTTNFDPLIGVSISAAGGTSFRTILHRDGNLALTDGDGCHVVHLHGYWYGSDTLHTPRQLTQPRPQLRSSLAHVLRNQIVVVLAYGGWDDSFTQALVDVVIDDNAYPEVIWCFRDEIPQVRTQLLHLLKPGLDRGRVSFYSGIDCHTFLPTLVDAWNTIQSSQISSLREPVRPTEKELSNSRNQPAEPIELPPPAASRLINANEDRPPVLDYYVGRSDDLAELENASYRLAFVTGMGGQGKSALVASAFDSPKIHALFDHRLWRDCKEQSEKFEDHLVLLIEALNDGRVQGSDLSKQPIEDLTDLFCTLTSDLRLLVIFDNVDHYVDLETRTLIGSAGIFVDRFLSNTSAARIIFTCRPSISLSGHGVFTKRLEGLSQDAARELFRLRGASASEELVDAAHHKTGGHAFWLDLLAAQVAARAPLVRLEDLLQNISSGTGEIPDATLRSIWQSLKDRERMVLQALAEALRPVSSMQLADFLRSRTNYNQISKAIRVLRGLNLLVVKKLDNDEEGFELHPVIRAFIHKTFKRSDRIWFIDAILSFYSAFFGSHLNELSKRASGSTMRRWIEGAELCVNAGHFGQAFERLNEVQGAIRRNASPVEFVRVVENLLESIPTTEWRSYNNFDAVFETYHRSLVNLGRLEDARSAIERYEETLEGKDARYIHYCDMNTYMYWMIGDYVSAIKWGTDGANLKKDSGVDTHFSSDHHLALAQRDSGAVDPALQHFLDGATVDEVLAPGAMDKDRGGSFYGNIGRCFHLMGQTDPALTCYAKSAHLIETQHEDSEVENQAYIRQWIGELLITKDEPLSAACFLVAALEKWKLVSPPRANRLQREIAGMLEVDALPHPDQGEAFAIRWIRASGAAEGA